MYIKSLKQALEEILKNKDIEDSTLACYLKDFQAELESQENISIEKLVDFFASMQQLIFAVEQDQEYSITLNAKTYTVTGMLNSCSFVATEIEKMLLEPLGIDRASPLEEIKRQLQSKLNAPTSTDLNAHSSNIPQKRISFFNQRPPTPELPAARHQELLHPLAMNSGTLIIGSFINFMNNLFQNITFDEEYYEQVENLNHTFW